MQDQSEELQRTNAELEDKAQLLAQQKATSRPRTARSSWPAWSWRSGPAAVAGLAYKSEFLANMSHELRTPLNSLLMLARLLADNAEAQPEPQAGRVRRHHPQGGLRPAPADQRHPGPVQDRGRARWTSSPAQIAFASCPTTSRPTFRPHDRAEGPGLRVAVAPGCPAQVLTDDQRLQQVLRNLLSNAVKFTDDGAVDAADRVAAGRDGASSCRIRPVAARAAWSAFAVADTGIGIADEKLESIFEAFQQADGTTSRKYGGTGLGLSISREIAPLLGGVIRAESTPGRAAPSRSTCRCAPRRRAARWSASRRCPRCPRVPARSAPRLRGPPTSQPLQAGGNPAEGLRRSEVGPGPAPDAAELIPEQSPHPDLYVPSTELVRPGPASVRSSRAGSTGRRC